MKAGDVMAFPVITVKASASVADVMQTLRTHRIGALPVLDERDGVLGMISDGDLARRAGAVLPQPRQDTTDAPDTPESRTALDVMSAPAITATPDTTLREIAMLLHRNAIKRVPIVLDGRLVGIVSRADLVEAVAAGAEGIILESLQTALQRLIPPRLPAESGEDRASPRTRPDKPRRPPAQRHRSRGA